MKRFHRSIDDRKIFGVCGGLGETLDVDPNLVRIASVLVFFVTGLVPLLITYLVAWFLLPQGTPAQQRTREIEEAEASGATYTVK